MNFRLLVIASCLLFFKVGDCQIGAESTPVSWNMSQSASLDPLWQTLPLLDVEALIDEDSQNEDKSVPYRFASAIGVHFDPQTSGQWINLPGGDRLWMLGIRCQNALSLSVTFGMFDLPEGAKMYIYDGGHKDYVGPLTVRNNTGNKVFATIPIRGSEVVVEYYEPFEYR
ncbi:MAG: hypothetical protein IT223_01985, partial [Crocinitomicaceae bacterium]|nr:hypothetical protein [Crocinitomicaceae bacterium]